MFLAKAMDDTTTQNRGLSSEVFEADCLSQPELRAAMDRLHRSFALQSMSHEEQALFMLEFARLAHDRHLKLAHDAAARKQLGATTFAENVLELISELIELRK